MGLKDMFGWTNPKDHYGDALGLAQVVTTASTATSLASLPYPNAAQNGGVSGYQNITQGIGQAQSKQQTASALHQQYNKYMQAQAIRKDEPPKVNLNEGAWSIPISQLVDLWIVKFGSKWVEHEEIATEEFYQIACARLEKMGKIETHHLQDRYMPVYKIVE